MKILVEGAASHPVVKAWFCFATYKWSIRLGVKLIKAKQNVGCGFSCVQRIATFKLMWVEVFL